MFHLGFRNRINSVLDRFHLQLVPASSLTYCQKMGFRPAYVGADPNPAIKNYVETNRHVLDDLRLRYGTLMESVGVAPFWKENAVSEQELLFFRGDNAYVWQHRENNNPENYILTYFYLKEIDRLDLLYRFAEEQDFGIHCFGVGEVKYDGSEIIVTRDLLDSVTEIYFLTEHLDMSDEPINVVDIGAGYGRLAHRICLSGLNIGRYFCIDAVPESSFICNFYLGYRKICDKASCVYLDQQEELSSVHKIHLAVNVHSFSECTRAAVQYWLRRCSELKIPYLFIVPNDSHDGSTVMKLHVGGSFNDIVGYYGYHLVSHRPKYPNPEVQKYGISPAFYFLFINEKFL